MSSNTLNERILVVDDAPETLEILERNLTLAGYKVLKASNVDQGVEILESASVDLVVTDLKMPGASGLDMIRHVKENYKDVQVMMITGYATINGAVEALKTGAEEYLAKPFTEKELLSAVRRALDILRNRRAERIALRPEGKGLGGLLGRSDSMKEVFSTIEKAARTTATVLIHGESGTGKELVARAIHYSSPRASSAFVPVNCGGIPGELLESELFGHMKGAFTGALETRAGFFLTAEGGTILLDEIGEMSLSMQVKLLRVLQDKEVYMVGSAKGRIVDVRILAATNKDLLALVEKGIFREDLFYRLNVVNVRIPPLRDREGDVPMLVHHFTKKYAKEYGLQTPTLSDRAMDVLKRYPWPGNVRELENLVQRLVVMTEGEAIDVPDLPHLMRFSAPKEAKLHRTLAEVELEHIRSVLASVGGNKTQAAEILDIDRKTLRTKLKPAHKPE